MRRLNFLVIPELILVVLCWGIGVFGENIKEVSIGAGKNTTTENKQECAKLFISKCKGGSRRDCSNSSQSIYEYWSKKKLRGVEDNYIVNVTVSHDKCKLILCEDDQLMGYCAQIRAAGAGQLGEMGFGEILRSKFCSMKCTCNFNDFIVENDDDFEEEASPFDRNYVGLVYSPYDKYWEPTGPNGTLKRVPWNKYTEKEIANFLGIVYKKFTYIATFGMGTASNTSEWYAGDKIAFVPKVAAELNANLGYPAIRVSVGIFRKDDVNVMYKSKELYNALDASEVANGIYNGTVWGITVTSQYVSDAIKAQEALDMITEVKKISKQKRLSLKVGIRIDNCREFIAQKRPEDDAEAPAYQEATPATYVPLTSLQQGLHKLAIISDYIICLFIPPGKYVLSPFPKMIKLIQSDFRHVRDVLLQINPEMKVIFETGVPSRGIGNNIDNNVENLKLYWYEMAKFAAKEHILFNMMEAVDQPWKNVQGSQDKSRNDINAPNGADGFYGWWKRVNNSDPAIYVEKISEQETATTDEVAGTDTVLVSSEDPAKADGESTDRVKILMFSFFGFIILTFLAVGYLWSKLRKAKKQIISPAYIEQFHSGGDASATKDDNYAVALRIPYDRKYELAKESFHIDKSAVMGSGQCGVVLRGKIKGREDAVAFKCTTPSSTVVDIKSLMSEIKILSYVGEHTNILCILGAYTKKIERGIVYVALEYCPFGSLESFLRKIDPSNLIGGSNSDLESLVEYSMIGEDGRLAGMSNLGYVSTIELDIFQSGNGSNSAEPNISSSYVYNVEMGSNNSNGRLSQRIRACNTQVDLSTMYKWAYQIASAMDFVANKNVTHADLASRNVLLASLDQVKVCDFGLSRKLYQEVGVIHDKDTPLPWRWMAPESLKHLIFGIETDVWSYGVTIWEIFSLAEIPYHGCSYDMQFTRQLEKGMRLPKPKYASAEIYEQVLECWELTPTQRPSFLMLKNFFQELLQTA